MYNYQYFINKSLPLEALQLEQLEVVVVVEVEWFLGASM